VSNGKCQCHSTPVCLTTYWQLWLYSVLLADKYSVTDGCYSFITRFWWFTTRPQGQPKWERRQHCTRPRMKPRPKNLALRLCWPRGLNVPAVDNSAYTDTIKTPATKWNSAQTNTRMLASLFLSLSWKKDKSWTSSPYKFLPKTLPLIHRRHYDAKTMATAKHCWQQTSVATAS